MALSPGDLVDAKYRVIGLIGEGGMGSVYEGENVRIGRRVAIKVMHAEVSANADFAKRFEREARAAARIGSAHICDVLDLGDLPGGESYMVLEFLEGESLADRMRSRGPMTVSESARIAHQLLEGLRHMHDAGIIHRDLKPANIFLSRTAKGDIVKILDFGVSKFESITGNTHQLTTTGAIMGTPQYMSPEQARGKTRLVDARSDLYSVGVILYRCLTGKAPFEGENVQELLFKIALEDPTAIEALNPSVDPGFAALVRKAMSREPDERYQSAREFQDAVGLWGRAQNRPSLAFDETMPSVEGAALPGASGARRSSSSPSIPQKTPMSLAPRTPSERARAASAGKTTPTAWTETNPPHPPTFGAMAPPLAARESFAPTPAAPVTAAPPPRRRSAVLVIGLLGAAAATAVGVAAGRWPFGSTPAVTPIASTTASSGLASAPHAGLVEPPAHVTAPPPVVLDLPESSTFADAASPGVEHHPTHVAAHPFERADKPPAPPASAALTPPSASAAASAPPSAPPPAPAPPASARGGRKIRTDL